MRSQNGTWMYRPTLVSAWPGVSLDNFVIC